MISVIPLPSSVYIVVGEIFIILAIALIALIFVTIGLGIYKRDLFPRFSFFLLTFLYRPVKLILGYMYMNPMIVDEISIALMNSIFKDSYAKIPLDKRILFLPQCLRHVECPAKVSPKEGIICKECGKCNIFEIKRLCKEKGIKMCIAPGGEFVKQAIKDKQPKAAMGIACQKDLYETMRYITSKGIPMVGLLLSRSGCVMTDVDWKEVKRKVLLKSV